MRLTTAMTRQVQLLLAIMNGREVSRHVLTQVLNLSFPSISRIVEAMISGGIVIEKEKFKTLARGGPKPIALSVHPELGYTIGVDIEGFMIRATVLDLSNHRVASSCQAINPDAASEIMENVVCRLVAKLLARKGMRKDCVMGIGLGLPGYVDPAYGGTRDWFGFRDMEQLAVAEKVQKKFGLPVSVEKNVNCVALAESRIGPHADQQASMAIVLVRFGIGCAFMIERRLLGAGGGRGGELGHTVVRAGGRLCICGRRGCLEAYAGGWALARELGKVVKEGEDITHSYQRLFNKSLPDDDDSRRVLLAGCQYLALGLSNIVRLLGSEFILVQGVYNCLGQTARDLLEKEVNKEYSQVRVSFQGLGEYSGAIGAAMNARDLAAYTYFPEIVFARSAFKKT